METFAFYGHYSWHESISLNFLSNEQTFTHPILSTVSYKKKSIKSMKIQQAFETTAHLSNSAIPRINEHRSTHDAVRIMTPSRAHHRRVYTTVGRRSHVSGNEVINLKNKCCLCICVSLEHVIIKLLLFKPSPRYFGLHSYNFFFELFWRIYLISSFEMFKRI